jgi:hypothetical protein
VNRRITNAYEAWWFLYYHPKLKVNFQMEVRDEKHAKEFANRHYRMKKDKGGNLWAVCKSLTRHAIQENLSIHYTKTNKPGGHGTVVEDKSKNKHIECWLEFGPLNYGYAVDWEWKEDHARESLQYTHDYRLDTGGTTFDEGLVDLAKNVLKVYGDYKDKK